MEVLAGLFAALAVFAMAMAVFRGRSVPQAVEHRFARLERDDDNTRQGTMDLSFRERVLAPINRRIRRMIATVLPAGVMSGIEHRLLLAGRPLSPMGFLLVQALAVSASLALLAMFLLSDSSGLLMLLQVVASLAIIALPFYWIRIKGAARRRTVLRALPDAVDLMVTTVEAGMGIDGALATVGRDTDGPLGEELRLAVRETTLGRSRREALQRLVDRTQVPELTGFIRALIQAEQTGIPIGQILRVQAEEMRVKRRQHAEAAAQRAPVKMILVLILLVLPSMLLLVMGPAMMRMADAI